MTLPLATRRQFVVAHGLCLLLIARCETGSCGHWCAMHSKSRCGQQRSQGMCIDLPYTTPTRATFVLFSAEVDVTVQRSWRRSEEEEEELGGGVWRKRRSFICDQRMSPAPPLYAACSGASSHATCAQDSTHLCCASMVGNTCGGIPHCDLLTSVSDAHARSPHGLDGLIVPPHHSMTVIEITVTQQVYHPQYAHTCSHAHPYISRRHSRYVPCILLQDRHRAGPYAC